jgi:hypothetical protein
MAEEKTLLMVDVQNISSPIERMKEKIIQWIFDNHMHHDYEEVLVKCGPPAIYDEKYVGCQDAQYPYVNSLDLEKFIKELEEN